MTVRPQYNLEIVETAVLEVAAELHPRHLTASELTLKMVGNADDAREVETVGLAIRNLREFGLFTTRDDDRVEPTAAALRAVELLT